MTASDIFEHISPPPETDDSVRRYFREICAIPLLTREQEAHLGRRMERAKMRRDRALSRAPLVQQQVIELLANISSGAVEREEVLEETDSGNEDLFAEINRRYANVAWLCSELQWPREGEQGRQHLKGRLARERVALARSIRRIPFRRSQWSNFTNALEQAFSKLQRQWNDGAQLPEQVLWTEMPTCEAGAGATYAELQATLWRIRQGERELQLAKTELVKANLRLVASVVKRHAHRGMHFLDLIQEGSLGLMRAADKFDYHRGFKFSTYAIWWITQAVTRAVSEKSRTIRVPVNVSDQLNRFYRVYRQLEKELGRVPADGEIAEHMQISMDKVLGLRQISQEPVSLDTPVGNDESSSLGDLLADRGSVSPVDASIAAEIRQGATSILKTLIPKEEQVLRMRFGLGCAREYTLDEIGQGLAVTRERVRRIELRALRKLRQPDNARLLRELMA